MPSISDMQRTLDQLLLIKKQVRENIACRPFEWTAKSRTRKVIKDNTCSECPYIQHDSSHCPGIIGWSSSFHQSIIDDYRNRLYKLYDLGLDLHDSNVMDLM